MRSALISLVVCGLAFAGCQTTPGGDNTKKDISMQGGGWYILNDPDDQSTHSTNHSLRYELTIRLSENTLASDLSEARIYLPDGQSWWSLPVSAFNESTHVWGADGTNFVLGDDNDALPLGTFRVTVTLADGRTIDATLTTNQPNSSSQGASMVVSEDSSAIYPSKVAALVRPTGVTAVKNTATGTLTIGFTENDARTYNGWVWCYGAAGNYLGGSYYFRNTTTHVMTTALKGGAFAPAGAANTLTLGKGDLDASVSLASVAWVQLVVSDGAQYASLTGPNQFDYKSASNFAVVTGQ